VARTLVDLGDLVTRRSLERAVEQAEILRLFDLAAVEEVLARAGRRRGPVLLSRVLEAYAAPSVTWITLGDGVAYRTDFLWRGQRLVIETDRYRFHSSRAEFERDRRRDQLLKLAGYEVLRFTGATWSTSPITWREPSQPCSLDWPANEPTRSDGRRADLPRGARLRHLLAPSQRANRLPRHPGDG
jgi:hypothetical protein